MTQYALKFNLHSTSKSSTIQLLSYFDMINEGIEYSSKW